ncbi:hypothetical protein NDU88_001588 [Pleurodeles waltl]|uniref:Uncharacterized protein n=1 Tax=Pleurodeles waltl TaxID=8319 RepID=A0AAV7UT78_PLEWA|nr:hypothetical protein NDU88_001588 [Pleurodeles waltl]
MPTDKSSCKTARQLLHPKALAHQRPELHQQPPPVSDALDAHMGTQPDSTMDHILQEITAVGNRLEGMDTKISELAAKSCSICTAIAGFQDWVKGLDHSLSKVENKLNQPLDKDQELQYLRDKLTDLKDRSRRDNVRFFGIPELVEGMDVRTFLKDTLPTLTSLNFSPALELQWPHRMAPRKDPFGRPWPIIACFLRHTQEHQLLIATRCYRLYN